jgi:hypothetical protein
MILGGRLLPQDESAAATREHGVPGEGRENRRAQYIIIM